MSLLAPARRSYRPGDRGERNPITPAQIALAVEYRSLGLSWACCGTLLRLSHNRLRVAVGTAIGSDPHARYPRGEIVAGSRTGTPANAPAVAADGRRGRE